MVVQHNISALNAQRNLSINNNFTSANLEKLSSGYRINRAADDAAGLAISEKMRGQIRGLNMATMNASNAVQLIQTAEGGLNETHAILHRMRELAVQSANGTYDNDVDRYNLDKELQALKGEIDRISVSTHYNGINLLDGTLGANLANALAGGAYTYGNGIVLPYEDGDFLALISELKSMGFPFGESSMSSPDIFAEIALTVVDSSLDGQVANLIINHGTDSNGQPTALVSLQVGGVTYSSVVNSDNEYDFVDDSGNVVASLACYSKTTTPKTASLLNSGNSGIVSGIQLDMANSTLLGQDPTVSGNGMGTGLLQAPLDETHPLYNVLIGTTQTAARFQIGANGTEDQHLLLQVLNMSTASLGTLAATAHNATGTITDISIATQDAANDAIAIIDAAVNQVSSTRADLGARQNRLEHTINNLGVTAENLTAAESTIRDVDMAKEMMEYTKNTILVQSAQAMLAQAQTMPQGVLQLLQ